MTEEQEFVPPKPWRSKKFVTAHAHMSNMALWRKYGGGSETTWRRWRTKFGLPSYEEVTEPLAEWDSAKEQEMYESEAGRKIDELAAALENNDSDKPPSIAEEIEIEQVKAKLRTQQKRNTSLVKEVAERQNFYDMLRDTIVAAPAITPPLPVNISTKVSEETMVALLSDLHVYDIIMLSQTLGFGEYNFKLFQQRMEKWAYSIVNITQSKLTGCHFPVLQVFMLGDLVSGNIHEELRENREGIINHAIVGGAIVIAQALMQLAQHFPHIDVVSVPGNHGRMTKKPSYKNRIENFDMIMTDMLSMILANQPNITITASPAFATIVEVENHSIFLSHGDTVRGWQGIPYYGFNRMRGNVREMMAFRGDKVDVFCHGHFHQAGYLAGPMILNGCMSGPDEFSVTNAMGVDHPHQMMFGMHAEQGMSSMYKLRLDKAEEQFPNPSFIYDPEIQVQEQVRALMDR